MKQLTCEMCGSTDLMKQDGVFVCQSCGCKYSVEEAKKMMVEGTVDVSGSTVKVDVSEKVKNLYIMARRAKDDCNAKLASKYYEMITFENPNDWEALFYFNYFKARDTNLGDMRYSVTLFASSLDSVFSLIDKSNINSGEKWSIAQEIVMNINSMCDSYIYWAKQHYEEFSNLKDSISELCDRACAIADLQKLMADLLEKYFAENSSKIVASYLKSYVKNYLLIDTLDIRYVKITLKYHSKKLIAAEDRIKKIEPEYKSLVDEISEEKRDNDNDSNEEQSNQKPQKISNLWVALTFIVPFVAILLMIPLHDKFGDLGVKISIGSAIFSPFIMIIIGRVIYEINEKKKQQNENKRDTTKTNNKSNNLENSNSNENTKKKRKIGIICLSVIASIIVVIVAISSFGNKINSDLIGTWRSEQDASVSITFKNNGDMIVRSSSAVDDGLSYEINGDTVVVTFANNDKETYGFAVEENTLIFGEKYYTKLQ